MYMKYHCLSMPLLELHPKESITRFSHSLPPYSIPKLFLHLHQTALSEVISGLHDPTAILLTSNITEPVSTFDTMHRFFNLEQYFSLLHSATLYSLV